MANTYPDPDDSKFVNPARDWSTEYLAASNNLPAPPRDVVDRGPRALLPMADTTPDWDDADDFVPPTPSPLSTPTPMTLMIAIGCLGAPIFLVFCAMAWRTVPGILITIAVVWFLAAFVGLVMRLPHGSRHDEDY